MQGLEQFVLWKLVEDFETSGGFGRLIDLNKMGLQSMLMAEKLLDKAMRSKPRMVRTWKLTCLLQR